ncbi:MAG: response regulator [Bacteroidota bacterium]|nr:response regulator [Bacteroidota bacterium]
MTHAGTQPTILLVEDEQALLEITQLNLESMGYSVLSAPTPEEALAALSSHKDEVDLLITDVIMPEMNGRALYEKMLESLPNLTCLYVSGYPADFVGRRGIIPEEVHFLAKPFTRAQLKEKVDELLNAS